MTMWGALLLVAVVASGVGVARNSSNSSLNPAILAIAGAFTSVVTLVLMGAFWLEERSGYFDWLAKVESFFTGADVTKTSTGQVCNTNPFAAISPDNTQLWLVCILGALILLLYLLWIILAAAVTAGVFFAPLLLALGSVGMTVALVRNRPTLMRWSGILIAIGPACIISWGLGAQIISRLQGC